MGKRQTQTEPIVGSRSRAGGRHNYENGGTTDDGRAFREAMLVGSSAEGQLKQLNRRERNDFRLSDEAE